MGFSDRRLLEASGGGFPYTIDAVASAAAMEAAIPALSRGGRPLIQSVADHDTGASVSPYDIYARDQVFITQQAKA